jgi:hypothetical protein
MLPRRMTRRLTSGLSRAALLLVASLAAATAAPASAGAAVRISGPPGIVLPASPAGLSVETYVLPVWWGPGSCRSPAREVLRMAGRPEIRIGGNSQDRIWPNADLPRGQEQVADAAFYHAVRCLGATGSPVLLGLNLLGRDPQATGDLLAAAGGLVPKDQLTIAIGNEPNLYGGRLPAPGGYAGYLRLYDDMLDALRARFGTFLPPVAGPDAATYRWAAESAQFIRDLRPAQADAHLYGLSGCRETPESVTYPTIERLLDPAASTVLVRNLRAVVQAAQEIGVPAQLSEINSAACRGVHGVSDSFASALWALRLLGDATLAGFSRLQFHSSDSVYDPFFVTPRKTVTFRPVWTAILLANALWPAGTRPMRVLGSVEPRLGTWAARRPDGGLTLLAVNRDLVHAHTLVLRTGARRALLGRVTPRGAYSVALNGRQLRWSKGRPMWQGAQRVDRPPIRHRRLRLAVAPGTAKWLVLDGARDARTPATLTAER